MECGICLESFPGDVMKFMPCLHFICSFCHNNIKKQECPYCRTPFENLVDSDIEDLDFEMVLIEENVPRRRKKKNKRRRNVRRGTENMTFELINNGTLNNFNALNVS